ncbi:class 1 fructose-bisphosphatase [Alteromonas aestuariivivens]|uniref:Fructose-1,6-bisphosphatase class 1 n=1 Tax=Alteromonas aestuariivivens TaxID=1938339 RepID=A0A3D8M7B8_9ALTE|nr:class 1 fructose-bisphosphatase [Alteromonas aestuariivivens]RDV25457.1 class 1 fructose-bisphosphatase [Alteromonas aestuariivivens]
MERLIPVLKRDRVDVELIMLIRTILAASKEISFRVSQGALAGVLGSTLDKNIQGEVQKNLDVLANQLLIDMLLGDDSVRAIASEEEDFVIAGHRGAPYIVAFDPLDGSSNVDVNGQIGTIFTIYRAVEGIADDSELQFLQPGNRQLCAGYVLYGASTQLVMTTGGPTRCYTLDSTHGGYLLTEEVARMPSVTNEFSVNLANYRYWAAGLQDYFNRNVFNADCGQPLSMRWNAAMVGDIHRIVCRGGLFLYPHDSRSGHENGKIRLLYEANPLAMIVENSGGKATCLGARILDLQPRSLHQRVSVAMGSKQQVDEFDQIYQKSHIA